MRMMGKDSIENLDNDTIETSKAIEENSSTNAKETNELNMKQNELLRRAKLEEEITESSLFKTLKESLGGRVSLEDMVPSIADNYLRMSTSSLAILGEMQAPIEIDSEVLKIAFAEFMYLISVEENGIVIDASTGEINVEATLQQRQAMTYRELTAEELTNLDNITIQNKPEEFSKKDTYDLLLKENTMKKAVENLPDHNFYSMKYNEIKYRTDLTDYEKDQEKKNILKEQVNSEEFENEVDTNRDKSFYNSKSDVLYDKRLIGMIILEEKNPEMFEKGRKKLLKVGRL